ncbi:MAG TPA: biotin/lipoyl-binding protein, partial [Methanospirillum sp.]|nr:biotin/lipoyl-binding protein [Methanospirillum sp.]
IYQLPGGMITNLISQLQEQDALDKLEAVFDEIPRVREDLGYPPLVTPTSQIVGTQAVFNVLTGGRYKTISNEVRDYVKGQYGRSPGPISDDIRRLIIGDEEVITVRPADLLAPMYEKMKGEAIQAGLIKKEEDVLTYILYPAIAPSFLKGERTAEPIPSPVQKKDAGLSMPTSMQVEVDGETFTVRILAIGDKPVEEKPKVTKPSQSDIPGGVKSNMQGMVLKIMVGRGDKVAAGDTLVVLEAMKMENPISSPRDGVVKEIFVDAGDTVLAGDVLLVVE